jgi:hypothetical protein
MTTLHDQWTALYAAGRVRWMPGMMDESGTRVLHVKDDGRLITDDLVDNGAAWQSYREHDVITPDTLYAPDFADPATEGCLLHQAREAWDADSVNTHVVRHHMLPGGEKWVITIGSLQPGIEQPTRVAAILAAIAAAPPKVTE